jgi:hypothetical protein
VAADVLVGVLVCIPVDVFVSVVLVALVFGLVVVVFDVVTVEFVPQDTNTRDIAIKQLKIKNTAFPFIFSFSPFLY